MVTLTGHAYCWDVLGDPAFPDRVAALGLPPVCLLYNSPGPRGSACISSSARSTTDSSCAGMRSS